VWIDSVPVFKFQSEAQNTIIIDGQIHRDQGMPTFTKYQWMEQCLPTNTIANSYKCKEEFYLRLWEYFSLLVEHHLLACSTPPA